MAGIQRLRASAAAAQVADDPIFLGEVAIESLVNENNADLLRVTSVTFRDGARNRRHYHAADQVLIATEGSGFVASDAEILLLEPGDIALVPKETRHWHGANAGQSFTHLSILTPGPMAIDDDIA